VNGLALCAGAGGLELGLRLALGEAYRCVGYVERDTYAAAILVARMADQALDSAPVWDDLATFDGRPWRGRVGLISAGFPCQPSSSAGDRRGTADERWLWPHIERIVAEVEPALVFIENVPGLLTVDGEQCCGVPLRRGPDRTGRCRLCGCVRSVDEPADLAAGGAFAEVLGSLASLGFAAEWDRFSASEVGASHLRERLFLLAHRDRDGRPLVRSIQLPAEREAPRRNDANRRGGATLADAGSQRRHRWPGSVGGGRRAFVGGETGDPARDGGGFLADPGRGGRRERAGSLPARESIVGPGRRSTVGETARYAEGANPN
jgi:DNA (cytosine-5)-methyltransferase 1